MTALHCSNGDKEGHGRHAEFVVRQGGRNFNPVCTHVVVGQAQPWLYHDKLLRRSEYSDGFIAQIREIKKVILTGSIPFSAQNPLPLKRDGYIVLWTIDDIEFDDDGASAAFSIEPKSNRDR